MVKKETNKQERNKPPRQNISPEISLFGLIMINISGLILFLFSAVLGIIPKNFSDNSWYSFGVMIFFVFSMTINGLFQYIHSKKDNPFLVMYFIYPLAMIILFTLGIYLYPSPIFIIPVLILIFILKSYEQYLYHQWNGTNWKILITILLMLISLNIGLTFVDGYVGEKSLSLKLYNCPDMVAIGIIKCNGINNHVIANDMVSCTLNPEYSIINTTIEFTNSDGLENITILKNKDIKFIVPENLGRISFKISSENKSGCFITSENIRFPDYQEFKQDKITFVSYFLALFGFTILTIPFFVKNISEFLNKE